MKRKIKIELVFKSVITYLVIRSRQGDQLERRYEQNIVSPCSACHHVDQDA